MVDDRLRRADYEVHTVPLATCQDLVTRFHYARGGSNTAVFRHGLFRRDSPDRCLGVAWWIPPTKSCALAAYPANWRAVLVLSRLVVIPNVPKNAASFLIMQSVRLIRCDPRWECLLTYADKWRGHTGAIYLATNWTPCGETAPEATFVDSSGRLVARKAGPHTRTRAEMAALGHQCVGRFSKYRFRMLLTTGRK